jgi:hypothetical protein
MMRFEAYAMNGNLLFNANDETAFFTRIAERLAEDRAAWFYGFAYFSERDAPEPYGTAQLVSGKKSLIVKRFTAFEDVLRELHTRTSKKL